MSLDDVTILPPLKIYKGEFKSSFCQKIINHVKGGKSIESFAGTIGVTRATVTRWAQENEEFEEAIDIARSLSLGYLEELAIDQVTGDSKGNATTLKFLMTNQHADVYKDKQVVESEGNVVFQIDTGIRRSIEDNAFDSIEVESKVLSAEDSL